MSVNPVHLFPIVYWSDWMRFWQGYCIWLAGRRLHINSCDLLCRSFAFINASMLFYIVVFYALSGFQVFCQEYFHVVQCL